MAFKFPFQSLLQHRKQLEEVAQRDYYAAKSKVDEKLEEINSMYKRAEEVRNNISERQTAGGMESQQINQLEEFLKGLSLKVEMARYEARELMQVAEERHDILVERVKEYKMIEKIKEKRKAEYKHKKNKKENKEMDDIVTMRFKR